MYLATKSSFHSSSDVVKYIDNSHRNSKISSQLSHVKSKDVQSSSITEQNQGVLNSQLEKSVSELVKHVKVCILKLIIRVSLFFFYYVGALTVE